MSKVVEKKQIALQLTGPDKLELNRDKDIYTPGPYQILCKVEAVGLCFSDLKLLKQFSKHARKTDIISGIDKWVLDEIDSYKPDDLPTVPGHEAVIRVCAIGDKVKNIMVEGRYLVQTDYRWLPTENSNGSFGYNFEGGLQQYVLMDQRVITSPEGESMLIPASEKLSASAIALVEPWACVENAYAAKERQRLKPGGKTLIVTDSEINKTKLERFLNEYGPCENVKRLDAGQIKSVGQAAFDDVIYFGSTAETVEKLFAHIAARGLLNIVTSGGKFGKDIVTTVGRVHYGGIRIIGTDSDDPADSMKYIPATGEIRQGDTINVVGAAGPMGVMHVVRDICQGVDGISIFAGDLDKERLNILSRIAKPLAEKNTVSFEIYDPAKNSPAVSFDYLAIMVPVPKLVADAVKQAATGGIINIFAGIPADVTGLIDLDSYIEKQLYFIGTSGSVLDDMRTVLAKVESGRLDTNISVGAISGLDGAIEGIRAVENRLISGKIVVYPDCEDLGLITLDCLEAQLPEVGQKLCDGLWNKEAEDLLLKMKD